MFSVLALRHLLCGYTVWIKAVSKSRACLLVSKVVRMAHQVWQREGRAVISGKTGRLKVCTQTFLQLQFNALSTR